MPKKPKGPTAPPVEVEFQVISDRETLTNTVSRQELGDHLLNFPELTDRDVFISLSQLADPKVMQQIKSVVANLKKIEVLRKNL